ncbi:MAG: hypothetical protein JW779_13920 [Candidatus Thorarchaeota archaeon]|nr:hypothetical protein [Candidatus Thorarchaeota archaeon]
MKKNTVGEIVGAQIGKIPATEVSYGYITIETPDKKYLKMKVDALTEYDTIDKGEQVVVEYDTLGNTDILSAKKIMKRK